MAPSKAMGGSGRMGLHSHGLRGTQNERCSPKLHLDDTVLLKPTPRFEGALRTFFLFQAPDRSMERMDPARAGRHQTYSELCKPVEGMVGSLSWFFRPGDKFLKLLWLKMAVQGVRTWGDLSDLHWLEVCRRAARWQQCLGSPPPAVQRGKPCLP